MIPSSNSCFHRVNAWTMLGSVHGTSPRVAATNLPGSMLSAMAWIVSMLNPAWAAPCTKHVTSLASNVAARALPRVPVGRRVDPVLVEQVLVDPDDAGEHGT